MTYKSFFKPIIDFVLSSMTLVLLLPCFIIIALLIKKDNTGPVFYKQKRMGKSFKPFFIYKFRSMVVNADKNGSLITHAEDNRITKIGAILRRYKLDELPQLLNVCKGDMSIVGPRPEVEKYCKLFTKDYDTILQVKPGITDPATLFYSQEELILSQEKDKEKAYIQKVLPEKIMMSKEYVESLSLINDWKLIFKTLKKIIVI